MNSTSEDDLLEQSQTPSTPSSTPATATASKTQTKPKSWVWTYFVPQPENKVLCTAPLTDGTPCEKHLTQDKTRSTKSMIEHLSRIHQIEDPKKVEAGKNKQQRVEDRS
ncbi:hypothetical protein PGT21_004883 [Puccinia graminis f. sp. tritici]|uniref:BED-type domain-containing protein n=1 Tax=Puccinia graminis f. sp. tritici TaxID=56615 RepID=A0A5B0NM75_PUCGR|nr:hypothetical protein PGT21_004883 [Puccinia graminis f. sp. tritici]